MKILVTGGGGFVGHHLIPALQERGHTVRVLVLPNEDSTWLAARDVAVYVGDVRQPRTLAAPMGDVDAVLHMAAMQAVWRPMEDYHAVNVVGTENVCRAALAAGVRRLVHISSWLVYGVNLREPAHEDSPLAPLREPYSLSKLLGENVVKRLIADEHLPAVIIRPDTIFGPHDYVHIGRMADRLLTGKDILVGSGRNILPFVYVTDVVQGLVLALEHERATGQVYNIANDQPLTQREFLRALGEAIGAKPPRIQVPYHALYTTAYAAEQVAKLTHARKPLITRLGVTLFGANNPHSMAKAHSELGFTPKVSILDGVQLASAWYRQYRQEQVSASARVSVAAP